MALTMLEICRHASWRWRWLVSLEQASAPVPVHDPDSHAMAGDRHLSFRSLQYEAQSRAAAGQHHTGDCPIVNTHDSTSGLQESNTNLKLSAQGHIDSVDHWDMR